MSFFTSGPQNCTPSSNRSKFLDFSIFNPSTFLLSRMRNCLLHVNGSRLGAGGRDIYRTNTFALRASAGHTAQHIQEPPFQTEENIWKDPRICPSVKLWKFPSLKLNVDRSKVRICRICSDHVVAPIFLGHFWIFLGHPRSEDAEYLLEDAVIIKLHQSWKVLFFKLLYCAIFLWVPLL